MSLTLLPNLSTIIPKNGVLQADVRYIIINNDPDTSLVNPNLVLTKSFATFKNGKNETYTNTHIATNSQ